MKRILTPLFLLLVLLLSGCSDCPDGACLELKNNSSSAIGYVEFYDCGGGFAGNQLSSTLYPGQTWKLSGIPAQCWSIHAIDVTITKLWSEYNVNFVSGEVRKWAISNGGVSTISSTNLAPKVDGVSDTPLPVDEETIDSDTSPDAFKSDTFEMNLN